MMNIRYFNHYFFTLLLLPAICLADLDSEVVRFSVVSFPPYFLVDDKGTISGIHKNLTDELFSRAGIQVQQINYPYARALGLLQTGQLGVLQFDEPKLTNESENFYFPVPPVPIEIKMWTAKPELKLPLPLEEYKGHSFAIVRDWPLGELGKILNNDNKQIDLNQSYSPVSAIKLLMGGRVDYLVTFASPFNEVVNKLSLDISKLKAHSIHISNGYSFAVPKVYPHAKALYTRLKAEYDKMVANGEIDTDIIMLKGDNPSLYIPTDKEE